MTDTIPGTDVTDERVGALYRPLGTYAALTRALGLRLPAAPELPRGAGEVLFVVGPGVETLRACVLHPGTGSEHLETLVAEVVATARTLAAC